MASSRKYGSSASIAFAYTLELEVEAATIAIVNAVSRKIFILVLLLFVSKFQMEEGMRSWCFFIFVEIERLLVVFVVVRKKRVFEFDVCLCFVLYDMIYELFRSLPKLVLKRYESTHDTELIDSWLDQTRYSLVLIPTGLQQ